MDGRSFWGWYRVTNVCVGFAVLAGATAFSAPAHAEYVEPTDDAGYAAVCENRGVPLPPAWGTFGPSAWTLSGEFGLSTHYRWGGDENTRRVFYYKQEGANPGVCALFEDFHAEFGYTVQLGVICQSAQGKTCFWETAHESSDLLDSPPGFAVTIADLNQANITTGSDGLPIFTGAGKAAPGNIEQGCTVCHQGENAFISHGANSFIPGPTDPTDLRDAVGAELWFPERWPDAIVPANQAAWPQFLGPDPMTALPEDQPLECAYCHEAGEIGGRFPLLVSNYGVADPDGNGFMDIVTEATTNVSSPPSDGMPPYPYGPTASSSRPLVQAMLARLAPSNPTMDNIALEAPSWFGAEGGAALVTDGENDGSGVVVNGPYTSSFNPGEEIQLDGGAYWHVYFGDSYHVRLLRIYSPNLESFRVLYWNGSRWKVGSDQDGAYQTVEDVDGNIPYTINVDFNTEDVIIQKIDPDEPLELAEVEIYGDHTGAGVGQSCEFNADCRSGSCKWSEVQNSNRCAVTHYKGFSEVSDLASFDEVTKLPTYQGYQPNWQVTSGQLYEPSNTRGDGVETGSALIFSDAVISDGWVQATMHSTDNDRQGLVFRYQDPDHFYSFEVFEGGWYLKRWDGNDTFVVLASYYNSNFDWASPHTLKVEGFGSTLEAYVDGVLMASVTDPTYASGRVGVWEWAQQNAYFDEFYAVDTTVEIETETFQLKANKDAMLHGGSYADDNYGTYTHYYMKANNNLTYARKFGVGFDIRDVGAVTYASLNLIDFIGSDPSYDTSLRVYGVHEDQGDFWSENAVTWNNFPGLDPTDGYGTDPSIATSLGTIKIEEGQDDGNHGLSLSTQALVNFLNEDEDGQVTFLITTNSKYHTGNLAARERSGSCKLQGTAQVGDCAPTLDITATPW